MGGDYTDLQSWQAGEQIFNWPTLGQNPVAEVYNDWPTGLPTNIYLDGWYSDANHPPVIRAAAGERHTGKRLSAGNYTGAALAGTVYEDAIFDVNDPNFQISGLILDVIPARGGGIRSRYGSSMHAQNCYFEGLIINNCSKLHGIELTGENDNVRVSNVLVTNGAADSYGIMVGLRANAWVYSCSIVDCGTGVYIDSSHAAADIVLKNILCHGNGTDFVRANSLGTLSVSNCASSDGTASTWGGTGNRANQTFTFEDEGNDDFHLSSSDAGAKGYGADLSGDANYPFNDDIDGDTRSAPWDIGADQVAGGPAAQQIYPTSIVSAEAFGNPSVIAGAVQVIMQAIASAEAHGTPIVTSGGITLLPSSIGSAEAFGDPNLVAGAVNIDPAGIGSDEAVGVPAISTGATIQPTGIVSAEAIGSSTITPGVIVITPSAIASNEAIGNPVVTQGGAFILPEGIGTGETFGAIQIDAGAVTVQPLGIESGETFGTHAVTPGSWIIMPPGIATAEDFGDVLIITGGAVISPAGIQSAEAFGSVTIIGGEQILGWLLGEISIGPALSGYVRSGKETRH